MRKWAFVKEGATKIKGGNYSGPRVGGLFDVFYVTGGNGVKFNRSPYAKFGWQVEKNNTRYLSQTEREKVKYNVTNADDITALNDFCGIEPYKGWGNYA